MRVTGRWRFNFTSVVVFATLTGIGCRTHEPLGPSQVVTPLRTTTVMVDGVAHLQGPGVVVATPWEGFHEESRFVVPGERGLDGACRFAQSDVRLKKGERIVDRVVEVDAQGCSFVVARSSKPGRLSGNPNDLRSHRNGLPAASGPGGPSASLRSSGANGTPRFDNASGCSSLPPADFTSASQRVYWTDPAWIPVASDLMQLYFTWDWYCVYDPSGYHRQDWFTLSNWSLSSYYTAPIVYDWYHRWLTAWGGASFYNPGFPTGWPTCSGAVTANVTLNQVYGYADGTASFNYSAYLTGPTTLCTNLLSLTVDRAVQ